MAYEDFVGCRSGTDASSAQIDLSEAEIAAVEAAEMTT